MTTQNLPILPLTEQEKANIDYATRIGNLIEKSQVTEGFQTFAPGDQDKAVAAWLELFRANGIPGTAINRLYLFAKTQRIEIFQRTGKMERWTCDFVVAQWQALKEKIESEQKASRLETKIMHGCRKCFGTNRVHSNWNNPTAPMSVKRITAAICDHLDDDGNPAFTEEN